MELTKTKEGLNRLTVQMPSDSRHIYFYTTADKTQKLNNDAVNSSSKPESKPIETPQLGAGNV